MIRRKVEVFNTADGLARRAAELFVSLADVTIKRKGKFTVVLSGGSTPAQFYTILSTDEFSPRVDWSKIHFFWADERCVPKDHPDSNFRLAFELLLSKIPLPDANIHRIRGELIAEHAASEYEKDLHDSFSELPQPTFDLVFLGLGTDGHTASLFPGVKTVNDHARLAIPAYVQNIDSHRVSLTLDVLNNSNKIVFLVTGKKKAGIVHSILETDDPGLPASAIKPATGGVLWLLDREAASRLPQGQIH